MAARVLREDLVWVQISVARKYNSLAGEGACILGSIPGEKVVRRNGKVMIAAFWFFIVKYNYDIFCIWQNYR